MPTCFIIHKNESENGLRSKGAELYGVGTLTPLKTPVYTVIAWLTFTLTLIFVEK
jgi:hypothetical protein